LLPRALRPCLNRVSLTHQVYHPWFINVLGLSIATTTSLLAVGILAPLVFIRCLSAANTIQTQNPDFLTLLHMALTCTMPTIPVINCISLIINQRTRPVLRQEREILLDQMKPKLHIYDTPGDVPKEQKIASATAPHTSIAVTIMPKQLIITDKKIKKN
jgi:hypothetical protein